MSKKIDAIEIIHSNLDNNSYAFFYRHGHSVNVRTVRTESSARRIQRAIAKMPNKMNHIGLDSISFQGYR